MLEKKTKEDRILDFLKYAIAYFLIAYFILGIVMGSLLVGPGQYASIGLMVLVGIVSIFIAIYIAYKKILQEIEEARIAKEGRKLKK